MRVAYALFILGILLLTTGSSQHCDASDQPNIVWIVVEDMSADFGCYGQTAIQTPHVDQLAAEGVRFTDAIITGPVCSAARSALLTGMYQTSIGAHHHRSGRGELKIELPTPVRPFPQLFRAAGYQVLNLTFEDFVREQQLDEPVRIAKTDYNFQTSAALYDRTHWAAPGEDRPFIAQVQLHGGKLRGMGDGDKWPQRVTATLGSRTPTSAVSLPPYLPNDPVIVEDWAQYLDTCRYTDWQVGRIVERLRSAGQLDNTFLFFITDHGVSHVRNKQFCYEGGVHIPLIIRGPGISPGTTRSDVVEHIDLVATSLALAGIDRPAWMQSQDILAEDYSPRQYVFAARDRCDETVDRIRCVRSERFKYIRNSYPRRPYLQPNDYKDNKPIQLTMRRLYAAGKLNAAQALIMAQSRPEEELYDLQADPYELTNLANDPAHADILRAMGRALEDWIATTGDQGATPESTAMFDSDMAAYLHAVRDRGRGPGITANIELMKRWAAEGK